MSDDERALVAAIQAAPDENTARLAYADWLDENGTTDQQRARAEWIRFTCTERSKRIQMPTGAQIRKAGEPAWLRANAPRLWPNLMRFQAPGPHGFKTHLSFRTGQIDFTVPLMVPLAGSPGASLFEPSVVTLIAERGVATRALVSFLRAALVAPAVARDEPATPIWFVGGAPTRCYTRAPGRVSIHRRPFALRGLAGVWDAIELGSDGDEDAPVKVFRFEDRRVTYQSAVEPLVGAALTKWAREQAARDPAAGA